jgi:hypothetical protein
LLTCVNQFSQWSGDGNKEEVQQVLDQEDEPMLAWYEPTPGKKPGAKEAASRRSRDAVAGVVNQRVPELRIDARNERVADPSAEYVLYWMIMCGRRCYNFSLQRAVEWAKTLGRPLLILEALRCGYDWASDRIHAFVLQAWLPTCASSPMRRSLVTRT